MVEGKYLKIVKYSIIIFFSIMVIGCYDPVYGPTVINEYNESILVTTEFKDGSVENYYLKPNRCTAIGKKSKLISLTLKKDGKLLYFLNKDDIDKLIKAKKKYIHPVLYISEKGLSIKDGCPNQYK